MTEARLSWAGLEERTYTMELQPGGADWLEVKRFGTGAAPAWHVDARLGGNHYKLGDAFGSREEAQGCALLLAMRHLPAMRAALRAALDVVPDIWWWKISPRDDDSSDTGAILCSRVAPSAEAAERSGRAAGGGWWLRVYGQGSARTLGLVPR
jgi:hypothetical protein